MNQALIPRHEQTCNKVVTKQPLEAVHSKYSHLVVFHIYIYLYTYIHIHTYMYKFIRASSKIQNIFYWLYENDQQNECRYVFLIPN